MVTRDAAPNSSESPDFAYTPNPELHQMLQNWFGQFHKSPHVGNVLAQPHLGQLRQYLNLDRDPDELDHIETLMELDDLQHRQPAPAVPTQVQKAAADPAGAAAVAKPAAMSLLEQLLPTALGGAVGAGYGAYKAPGHSKIRGALIGGLGGAGAGAGLSGMQAFLSSPHAATIDNSAIRSALTLGGAGIGLHGGLTGGRALAEAFRLGNPEDNYENDLAEIDPSSERFHMVPKALRDYLPKRSEDEQVKVPAMKTESPRSITTPAYLNREISPDVKTTLDRMCAKQASLENVTAEDIARLGTLAGAGLVAAPYAYGAVTAPSGHRLHGAGSAAAQTTGTVAGGALGLPLGGLAGQAIAQHFNLDPGMGSALGAGVGTAAGAGLGNALSRAMYPGPVQLGLGEHEKQAAAEPNSPVPGYKVQYPWTLKLTNGKSTIARPTIGKPVPGLESQAGQKGVTKATPKKPEEVSEKVTESELAPGKVANVREVSIGQRLVFSPESADMRSADAFSKSALKTINDMTPELNQRKTVSKAAQDVVAMLG